MFEPDNLLPERVPQAPKNETWFLIRGFEAAPRFFRFIFKIKKELVFVSLLKERKKPILPSRS